MSKISSSSEKGTKLPDKATEIKMSKIPNSSKKDADLLDETSKVEMPKILSLSEESSDDDDKMPKLCPICWIKFIKLCPECFPRRNRLSISISMRQCPLRDCIKCKRTFHLHCHQY